MRTLPRSVCGALAFRRGNRDYWRPGKVPASVGLGGYPKSPWSTAFLSSSVVFGPPGCLLEARVVLRMSPVHAVVAGRSRPRLAFRFIRSMRTTSTTSSAGAQAQGGPARPASGETALGASSVQGTLDLPPGRHVEPHGIRSGPPTGATKSLRTPTHISLGSASPSTYERSVTHRRTPDGLDPPARVIVFHRVSRECSG